MKLTQEEKDFFEKNKELLLSVFNRRIDELKEKMVVEADKRQDRANLITEIRYLMQDFGITSKSRKVKKDTFV